MLSHSFHTPHDALSSWRFREIRNVADVARYWGNDSPAKCALSDSTRTRTWAALDGRSNAIANRLKDSGIGRGSPIGFLGKNSIEFFEIWFGVTKAGAAMTPFNWRSAVEELVGVIHDAGPPLIFVSEEFHGTLKTIQERGSHNFIIVPFGDMQPLDAWLAGAPDTDPGVALSPTDIALISYTSGTTGQPKGVMTSHEAFAYSFLSGSLEPTMSARDNDVMLVSMPNFHLGGSWISLSALYQGAMLSIIPAFEPATFLAAAQRDGATIAALVPTAIQLLILEPTLSRTDLRTLRTIMYFGSSAGSDLLHRAAEMLSCTLCQCYGTTESWIISMLDHREDLPGHPDRLASCGRPLPLVNVKIAVADGAEVSIGSVGEILVRSPEALSGYRNRPEEMAESMRGGWYHTGDLGRFDEDGFLYLIDRANDMIISGGENIYSIEIEQALAKLPGIAACAVVGLPDLKWGERTVAAVVLKPSVQLSATDVTDHCRRLIAGYKVPKEVRFLPALPLTSLGKIRKNILRDELART
jgi:acyl-CoA synthetase (AMP-forming)/AMP-acid ligase II